MFVLFWPQTCQKRSCWNEIWDVSMSKSCVKLRFKTFSLEKGVGFCFETSDSNTVQTKFRINTERIFGLSQKNGWRGFGAVGYLLKRPNLGSSDIQFRLENRIHEEQILQKISRPSKTRALKEKKSWWLWNPKPTNHKPTKTPKPTTPETNKLGPECFLFLVGGGERGESSVFIWNEALEKLRDLFWW